MPSKRELLGNELMKEVVAIRIDTLWSMLSLLVENRMPPVDAEKATGYLDDKGAIFLPGGLVFQDWEGNPIRKKRYRDRGPDGFRRQVREAMRYDGAHLFYQDGLATRIKLGNSTFSRIASQVLGNKKEALRRAGGLGTQPARITSSDISRSYCPTWIPAPYGSRTALSSDLSVCLTEPRMYFRETEGHFNLREAESERFWEQIGGARQTVLGTDDVILAQPHVVTCHSTRYREEILTGVTRISGFGHFGEFATFTLELATTELLNEVGTAELSSDETVASYAGFDVAAVLRVYPRTNPGARLKKGVAASLVAPQKDLGLDLDRIEQEARKRYGVKPAAGAE